MIRNEYRRAFIMLRAARQGYGGHVRLERRTLTGSMYFVVTAPQGAGPLRAALVGQRDGQYYAAPLGALARDRRGQLTLACPFDPRSIDGRPLEAYAWVAVAEVGGDGCGVALTGNVDGSRPVDPAALERAVCARFAAPTPEADAPAADLPEPDAPAPRPLSIEEVAPTGTAPDGPANAAPGPDPAQVNSPATPSALAPKAPESASIEEVAPTGVAPDGLANAPASQSTESASPSMCANAPAPSAVSAQAEAVRTAEAAPEALDSTESDVKIYTRTRPARIAREAVIALPANAEVVPKPAPQRPGEAANPAAASTANETTASPASGIAASPANGTAASPANGTAASPANTCATGTGSATADVSGDAAPDCAGPRTAAQALGLDITRPWPGEAESLRRLFATQAPLETPLGGGYVYVEDAMPAGSGYESCLVGLRTDGGRITGIRYALPGRQAPEPPAGLERYAWLPGTGSAGWWALDTPVN